MATELEDLKTDIVEQTDFRNGEVRVSEDKDKLRVVDHTSLDLFITFGDIMTYDIEGTVCETEVEFEGLSSTEVINRLNGNLFE